VRVLLAGPRALAEKLLVAFDESIDLVGFADTPDALEALLRNLKPDAIVLDWEFSDLLRDLPGFDLPIVVLPAGHGAGLETDGVDLLRTAIALTGARNLAAAPSS
jgi:hypothetical protein